jgi:cell division protein FtsL
MRTVKIAARPQRLERERDPRVRRTLLAAVCGATLLVVVGLGLTALRVHDRQLAYRLDALRAERARSERVVRELRIEIATLSAPARLEMQARQLGMTAPGKDQVRLAREYVPAASGPAAAARVAGSEALVR